MNYFEFAKDMTRAAALPYTEGRKKMYTPPELTDLGPSMAGDMMAQLNWEVDREPRRETEAAHGWLKDHLEEYPGAYWCKFCKAVRPVDDFSYGGADDEYCDPCVDLEEEK